LNGALGRNKGTGQRKRRGRGGDPARGKEKTAIKWERSRWSWRRFPALLSCFPKADYAGRGGNFLGAGKGKVQVDSVVREENGGGSPFLHFRCDSTPKPILGRSLQETGPPGPLLACCMFQSGSLVSGAGEKNRGGCRRREGAFAPGWRLKRGGEFCPVPIGPGPKKVFGPRCRANYQGPEQSPAHFTGMPPRTKQTTTGSIMVLKKEKGGFILLPIAAGGFVKVEWNFSGAFMSRTGKNGRSEGGVAKGRRYSWIQGGGQVC